MAASRKMKSSVAYRRLAAKALKAGDWRAHDLYIKRANYFERQAEAEKRPRSPRVLEDRT